MAVDLYGASPGDAWYYVQARPGADGKLPTMGDGQPPAVAWCGEPVVLPEDGSAKLVPEGLARHFQARRSDMVTVTPCPDAHVAAPGPPALLQCPYPECSFQVPTIDALRDHVSDTHVPKKGASSKSKPEPGGDDE